MPLATNLKELGTDFDNYFVDCSTNQTCKGIKTFANGLITNSSTIATSFGSASTISVVSNNTPFVTNVKLNEKTDLGTIFTDLSSNQTCYGIKTFQNGVSAARVQLSSPFGTAVSTPSYSTASSYYPTLLNIPQSGGGTLTDLGKLFLDLSTNQTTYGNTSFTNGLYTLQYKSLIPFDLSVIINVQGGVNNVDYTVSSVNGYYVLYMYNSSNSGQSTLVFSFSQAVSANVILVAGGGGGGGDEPNNYNSGGGGGGGGVGTGVLSIQKDVTYTAIIGAGGTKGSRYVNGGTGLSTSLSDSVSVINETATGGVGGFCALTNMPGAGERSGTGSSSSTGSSRLSYNPIYSPYNGNLYSNGGSGGGAGGNGTRNSSGTAKGGPGIVWSIDNRSYGYGGNGGFFTYSAPYGPATNSGAGSIGHCVGGNYQPNNGAAGVVAIAFQTSLPVVW